MDRPFIQKMCESYYSDFTLGKTNIWSNQEEAVSELSGEISKLLENLKLEDIELYREMFEFNRQKQYHIIYHLLEEYMVESFSDEILPEDITESALAAGVVGAGLIGLSAGFKPITKAASTAIAKFGDTVESIAKSISKFTSRYKIYNAIIFSDREDCYRSCGMVDQKDLTRLAVLRGVAGVSVGKTAETQIKCLTACFFKTSIDVATVLAKSYVQCVSATGDTSQIKLQDILGQSPVRTCRIFHNKLMELRKEFETAVDYLYRGEDKRKLLGRFDEAISTGLKATTSFKKRPTQSTKKRF